MNKNNNRIKQRLKSDQKFFSSILELSMSSSSKVGQDYVEIIGTLASNFRDLLLEKDLIGRLEINHKKFWNFDGKKKICQIDGGTSTIKLDSAAAPLAIRSSAYFVKPGAKIEREEFKPVMTLMTELYDTDVSEHNEEWNETVPDDLSKIKDASRILIESSSIVRILHDESKCDCIMLHGPLINPAAPYGNQDLPRLTISAIHKLLPNKSDINKFGNVDSSIVGVYYEILKYLNESKQSIYGVVERPSPKPLGSMTKALLDKFFNKEEQTIDRKTFDYYQEVCRNWRITDSNLFNLILDEGEYIKPLEFNKQLPEDKWPQWLSGTLRLFPNVKMTYLKCSENNLPLRIESFDEYETYLDDLSLILHQSRLLRKYGFPVGLHIADKYAKVPDYISKGIASQYKFMALKKAYLSGNKKTMDATKKLFMVDPRSFFNRPK